MKARARKFIIWGGLVGFVVGAGALAIRDRMAGDPYPTGTVQITRQGSSCQRVVINNSHGGIQSSQQIACADAPKIAPTSSEAVPPPRYSSGGRIEAIRDSFRNR